MPKIRIPREKVPLVTGIAVVAILASLFSIWRTAGPTPSPIEEQHVLDSGQVAGERTAEFLGPGKTVVVVRHGEPGTSPVLDRMHEAFMKALKEGGVSVAAEEIAGRGDGAPDWRMLGSIGIPVEEYLRMAAAHPTVDAIVSRVGGLFAGPDDLDRIPEGLPPLIIARSSDHAMPWLDHFDRGLLIMAIVPRYDTPEVSEKSPETPQEWFDAHYQVVTAENAHEVPR